MNLKPKDLIKKLLSYSVNESRSPLESTLVPEVEAALKAWPKLGVIVGGIALGCYARPRATLDVDVIFLSNSQIPAQVPEFKKIRDHSYEHTATGVEIECLSPEFLGIPAKVVQYVYDTAVTFSDGYQVASVEGLIALKACAKRRQDQADIVALLKQNTVDIRPLSSLLDPASYQVLTDLRNEI